MMLAHHRRDKKEVARLMFDEMGVVTKRKDPEIAYLLSAFWFDRMTPGMPHAPTHIDH